MRYYRLHFFFYAIPLGSLVSLPLSRHSRSAPINEKTVCVWEHTPNHVPMAVRRYECVFFCF